MTAVSVGETSSAPARRGSAVRPTLRMARFVLPPIGAFAVGIGLWQLVIVAFDIPGYMVPSPATMFTVVRDEYASLAEPTWVTLRESYVGFLLAIVVGVAVLREGSEVVLFLYGVLAGGDDSTASVAFGGFAGLALGAAICMLTYFGLVRIPMRALFATTTVLIALLAAGMAAQAAAFLEKANWLTALDDVVWDSGWLLSDASIPGKALHTLIGYTDQPTAMQLIVYVAILAVTFVLMRLYGAPVKAQAAAARG